MSELEQTRRDEILEQMTQELSSSLPRNKEECVMYTLAHGDKTISFSLLEMASRIYEREKDAFERLLFPTHISVFSVLEDYIVELLTHDPDNIVIEKNTLKGYRFYYYGITINHLFIFTGPDNYAKIHLVLGKKSK